MTEYTPSQAEGERDDDMANEAGETRHDPPRSTPSQAEGEREEDAEEERSLPDGPDPYGPARGEEEPLAAVERTERPGASSGPVTRAHVRELLAESKDSATLVLLEGRAKVIVAAERNTDWYAGAIDVMSGEELARRIGTHSPSDRELDMLAGTLNTMVAQLGA